MLTIRDRNIYYIVALGVFLRLIVFTLFYNHIAEYPDSSDYYILAEHIQKLSLEGYNGWRSPGYSLFLLLGGEKLRMIIIFQNILGVIAGVLWYKTLINLKISKKLSLYTTLLMTTFLHVIFYEAAILTESITLFFLSCVVYILSKYSVYQFTFAKGMYLSIALGILVIIKPFYIYLPFLIFGMWLIKGFQLKKCLGKLCLIVILPLFTYLGWSYVNKLHTGYFVSSTFLGLNMAQNCVHFAEKGPEKYNWIIKPYVKYREKSIEENRDVAMSIWYAYHQGAFKHKHLSFPDLSNELGEYAKATIRKNPGNYIKQVVFKSWLNFWEPSILWRYDEIKTGKKLFLGLWYVQKVVLYFYRIIFILLIPYFIYRFMVDKKLKKDTLLFFIVFTASVLQAMVTYGSNSRYSFPLEFMMLIVVTYFLAKKSFMFKVMKNKIAVGMAKYR
ncbi:MAG: phospholipid carrier-dependent glycosyltransferase [Mesonia sp.]|uniref:phospholipid carrier-dependent glycosyltransferase n=1 Tax=Mesonia sp. TaxID=1960830 RepID=UPI003F94372B